MKELDDIAEEAAIKLERATLEYIERSIIRSAIDKAIEFVLTREPSEDERKKIIASLLLQLWITLPQIPTGTMPNYTQAWDMAESVYRAMQAALLKEIKVK